MDRRIRWLNSIPFFAVHVVAVVTPFVSPFGWSAAAWVLGLYYLRMFAITGGFHRYFAHRTYKTSRAFQLGLALLGMTSVQKGVLWWAAHHRHHHKYSDLPEDVHSPRVGFWWSHVGWFLSGRFDATRYDKIRDFAKYPELVWLNEHHYVVDVGFAVALFAAFGVEALLWGFFVSTVLLWHGTFTINSLSHVFGTRRWNTADDSKNNFVLALITMGEGWHNNHHHYQSSVRQGLAWWELDATYYILKALSWVGIVWDLRPAPALDEDEAALPDALRAG